MRRTTLKTKIIAPESLGALTLPLWFSADEFGCMKNFQRYYPERKLKSCNCFYEFRKQEQKQQKLFNSNKQIREVDDFVEAILADFQPKNKSFPGTDLHFEINHSSVSNLHPEEPEFFVKNDQVLAYVSKAELSKRRKNS